MVLLTSRKVGRAEQELTVPQDDEAMEKADWRATPEQGQQAVSATSQADFSH
jgi:hypothetical protein